jgi:hypothetical protein
MDADLVRFLAIVRARARRCNRAVYEDVVQHVARARQHRPRGDLTGCLADWMLRDGRLASARGCRRFVAALRVLERWLLHEHPANRRRARVALLGRQAVRAAGANQLLAAVRAADRASGPGKRDGYFRVTLYGERHVVLRDLASGALVGPVPLPSPVVAALPPGAILGLRLSRTPGGWSIAAPGVCYPAASRPHLQRSPR